jgi:ankyrin repeat protein
LFVGYDEITKLLLAKGANVDEPSSHGTPLVAAAAHGKFSSMKILLEHNADVISKFMFFT